MMVLSSFLKICKIMLLSVMLLNSFGVMGANARFFGYAEAKLVQQIYPEHIKNINEYIKKQHTYSAVVTSICISKNNRGLLYLLNEINKNKKSAKLLIFSYKTNKIIYEKNINYQVGFNSDTGLNCNSNNCAIYSKGFFWDTCLLHRETLLNEGVVK